MKEITRINLASLPYNVEIEAKKELEKYCAAIEHSLGADDDAMREIEARMVELLAERGVTGEKVISSQDVAAIKAQLGEAKDFAGEDDSESADSTSDSSTKRLMRDTNNGVLGGVCAGVAAYLGVDTVLVRVVAAALLVATFGVAVPVYLLMWLIIPPARTAADRLAMAGKPVTLATIKDEAVSQSVDNEPSLVTFLRYMLAGLLLMGVLGILITMAYGTYQLIPRVFAQPTSVIALVVITALSGVALVVLLSLLAFALINKRFTQKMGIALITILLVGISCLGVGMFGLHYYSDNRYSVADSHIINRDLNDLSALVGAKQLIVDIGDAHLVYSGSETVAVAGHLQYDDRNSSAMAGVTLTRSGDTVTLTARSQASGCSDALNACSMTYITISGPLLNTITAKQGIVYYDSVSQETINLNATGLNTSVGAATSPAVGSVKFTASDGAAVDLTQLNPNTRAEGSLHDISRLIVDRVKDLSVTVPTVCDSNQGSHAVLVYTSIDNLQINGTKATPQSTQTCLFMLPNVR